MIAIRAQATGGPEVLRAVELPMPVPAAGGVLVRVEAAGVNYIDVYHRTGLYPMPVPIPIGLEGAGVVEALGAGVTTHTAGDRVAWQGVPGSYATHHVVPAGRAAKLPVAIDSRTGAALMLQGMTAHYLVRSTYPLKPGDACLVHAAAGGVGLLLCQVAKRAGARVFATVSTEEKAALAREAGADEVILYGQEDFADEVKRRTDGRLLQVVYDSVGKTTFEKSLECLAPRGMLVLFGQSSGAVPPIDPRVLALGGSLFLTRPALQHYDRGADYLERANELFDWARRGELRVRIGGTYALAEAAAAHRDLESRKTTGKLLLLP